MRKEKDSMDNTNNMHKLLLSKLNNIYKKKGSVEDCGDYIMVYNKSMAFVVEVYDYDDDTTYAFSGLNYVDTYDMGQVTSYNEHYQIGELPLMSDEDVDNFIEEFTYLVQTCDADKRVTKIMKMLDKINDSIDRDTDWDFLNDAFRHYFD